MPFHVSGAQVRPAIGSRPRAKGLWVAAPIEKNAKRGNVHGPPTILSGDSPCFAARIDSGQALGQTQIDGNANVAESERVARN